MPKPDGTSFDYAPGDVANLAAAGYTYDDLPSGAAPRHRALRLTRLGARTPIPEVDAMAKPKNTELVGATRGATHLEGKGVSAAVKLDQPPRRRISASLRAAADGTGEPDRLFLNLENVRGKLDAVAFNVYVGLDPNQNPEDNPEHLAGSTALFGVSRASDPNGEHGGQGLHYTFDITDIVDSLHLQNALDVESLHVRIVPIHPVPADAEVRVGRISIYRQST